MKLSTLSVNKVKIMKALSSVAGFMLSVLLMSASAAYADIDDWKSLSISDGSSNCNVSSTTGGGRWDTSYSVNQTCEVDQGSTETFTLQANQDDDNQVTVSISGNCQIVSSSKGTISGDGVSATYGPNSRSRSFSVDVKLTGSQCTITSTAKGTSNGWRSSTYTATQTETWQPATPYDTVLKLGAASGSECGGVAEDATSRTCNVGNNQKRTFTIKARGNDSNGSNSVSLAVTTGSCTLNLTGSSQYGNASLSWDKQSVTTGGGYYERMIQVEATMSGSACVFTANASSTRTGLSKTWTETWQKGIKTITANAPATVLVGDVFDVNYSVNPGSETVNSITASGNCVVTSGNTNPAKITASGFTGEGTGSCTLTLTSSETQSYGAATQTVDVIVKKHTQTITIDQAMPASMKVGDQFTVKAHTDSGQPVAIQTAGACTGTGDNGVADITVTGAGACTITYSAEGNGSYYKADDVVESATAAKGDQTITVSSPSEGADFGVGSTFVAAATAPSGNVQVSASGGCYVDGSAASPAVIKAESVGACTVSFSSPATADYNAASTVTRTVTISIGAQHIIPGTVPSQVHFGDSLTITATASSNLPVHIASTGDCTAVEGDGSISITVADGEGTCTITYTQAGDVNYKPAPTVTRAIKIVKVTPKIVITQPASARLGDNFDVSAVLDPTDPDHQNPITVSTNGQCEVVTHDSQNGLVNATIKITAAGICTVYYNAAETDAYSGVTAERNTRVTIATDGTDISTIWKPAVLFTAKTSSTGAAQPITAAPGVTRDPNVRAANPNLMVVFGTGLYAQISDLTDQTIQSVYAVHDRGVYGLNRYGSVSGGKTTLEQREFVNETITDDAGVAHVHRKIDSDAKDIDWQHQFGWYIDLTGANFAKGDGAERSVYRPIIAGNLLAFSTVIPQRGACTGSTKGAIVQLDWTNGLASRDATYDANMDGVIDSNDQGYVGEIMEGISQVSFSQNKVYYSVQDDIYMQDMKPNPLIKNQRVGWEEKSPYGIKAQ